MATETSELTMDASIRERTIKTVKKLAQNKHSLVGLLILIPIITASILAPMITPHPPNEEVGDRYMDPDKDHLMGTDHLGRDIFTRVIYAGRSSLSLGIFATALSLLVGVPIGIMSGYVGGRTDEIVMRFMDSLISFPSLLLALLFVAMLGPSLTNAIIAIAIVYTPRLARFSRSSTLSIKQEEYITAAEARGESKVYICFSEILPNALGPVVVEGSIRIGFAILIGTSLSFLGLGTQPPTPDWGVMISTARLHVWNTIWFWLWPSLFLGLSILGFNLLGDGLRDIIDPQIEGGEGM